MAGQGWFLYQLDVSNAFLRAVLDEEVYIVLLPGFNKNGEPHSLVRKMTKSIYGLKRASRQWFSTFSNVLLSIGLFNQRLIIPYSHENKVIQSYCC